MDALVGDRSLYIRLDDDGEGIPGQYVDDGIMAGEEEFQTVADKTLERFESKQRVYDDFDFFGQHVRTVSSEELEISQSSHIDRVVIIPKDVLFAEFQLIRAAMAWICISCPDVSCVINRAAQVTEENMCNKDIVQLNAAIRKVKDKLNQCLRFVKLDLDSLYFIVYVDASFATNKDYTSQLCFVVLFCDKNDGAHVIDFSSRKARRIVRSIMGGEVLSFSAGYDRAIVLQYDLEKVFGCPLPLTVLTDS